jgi:hypothetical protein
MCLDTVGDGKSIERSRLACGLTRTGADNTTDELALPLLACGRGLQGLALE